MLFKFPQIEEMTDDTINVMSSSSNTADVSPIPLKSSTQTRLRFVPILVNNPNDPQKSVEGKIVFERKKKADTQFPSEHPSSVSKITKSSIKTGDWLELKLNTSETLALYEGLGRVYSLFTQLGSVPTGFATYTRVDSVFRNFLDIMQNDPQAAVMLGDKSNFELVKILLEKITSASSFEGLRESLSNLQNENLNNLSISLNIERLQRVAHLMADNLDNSSEEYWQSTIFKDNQWILAQIFSKPCTIFQDKAYMGGKGINNSSGNVCDFLYKNNLSNNIAIIEIKTPCTKLCGTKYRGTYSMSHELSGAVNQVLNYKDSLTKEYYIRNNCSEDSFRVLSPECVVIVGKLSSLTQDEIDAFELYRNSLNGVIVITFDELYQRIQGLIDILRDDNDNDYDIDFDSIPF